MSKITVDADALRQVLQSLLGPGHLIRELMVIHDLAKRLPGSVDNDPVGRLINDYNSHQVDQS
jgi:hypothetical protein